MKTERRRQSIFSFNLRDCYDLVFSDPVFYDENIARIEYAIHQAVEDTKIQKKKNRADVRLAGTAITGGAIAGATAATLSVGGIAAVTFPLIFPAVGIATALVGGTVASKGKKASKKADDKEKIKRASSKIVHSDWLCEAFDEVRGNEDECEE